MLRETKWIQWLYAGYKTEIPLMFAAIMRQVYLKDGFSWLRDLNFEAAPRCLSHVIMKIHPLNILLFGLRERLLHGV